MISISNSPHNTPQGAFRALADPTRRQILNHLANGEMTIAQVSNHFDVTRAAIKKHLVVLEEGNLIAVEKRGRERLNKINPCGLKPVAEWLRFFDQFWDTRLGNLQQAIEKGLKKEKTND